jgi:hypothetical protein
MTRKIQTLAIFIFSFTIFSCTNIYYIGQTTTPLNIYSTADTTSVLTYSVPVGTKILTQKKSRKYQYIIYNTYRGYTYKPFFSNYHRYNSTIDGELYGYSSNRSYSTGSSSRSSSGGSVNVKGYTRKNGTYVSPHTRSSPSRKH